MFHVYHYVGKPQSVGRNFCFAFVYALMPYALVYGAGF